MSDGPNDFLSVEEIRERIRNRVRHMGGPSHASGGDRSEATEEQIPSRLLSRIGELHRNLRAANSQLKDVGAISPRPSGWKNGSIQQLKRSTRKLLNWILRPLGQFNSSVLASLNETALALEDMQAELASMAQRVRALEHSEIADGAQTAQQIKLAARARGAVQEEPLQQILSQIELLRNRIEAVAGEVRSSLPQARSKG